MIDAIDTPAPDAAGASALAGAGIYDVLYKHRYRELDGLRGIASLMVGVGHGLGVVIAVPGGAFGGLIIRLAGGFINGGVAVDLFFIMSGFFLSGMLGDPRSGRLSQFYARRFVRLVPPAVAAMCLFILASRIPGLLRPSNAGFATEFMKYYPDLHHVPLKDILLNLVLVRHTMNPPLWTIRVELFTSVLFPLVVFLKTWRGSVIYRLALLAVLVVIGAIVSSDGRFGFDVFHYLYIFYCGALIRDFGPQLRRLQPFRQYILFYAAIIGLLVIGHSVPLNGRHPFVFDLPVTFFGSLLVALLGYGEIMRARSLMNSRIVQFFGRISYSFYLMNWLSVMAIGSLVIHSGIAEHDGVFAAILILTGGAAACNIVLGLFLHVVAEQPAVGLSRHLAGRSAASR
jgi:peptidoglycan/LPS O-acetylase OafA/YrhL